MFGKKAKVIKEDVFEVCITENLVETSSWFGFKSTAMWNLLVVENGGSLFCPININQQVPAEAIKYILKTPDWGYYFSSKLCNRFGCNYREKMIPYDNGLIETLACYRHNLSRPWNDYFPINMKWKAPLTLSPYGSVSGFCKISCNREGSFKTELVHSLDDVCLTVLRELPEYNSPYIDVDGYEYDDNLCIWEFPIGKETIKLTKIERLYLRYAERNEVSPTGINSTLSHYEKRAVTFGSKNAFENSEGVAPQQRANSFVTYIAKGEYYVLYGGLIPMRNIAQATFDEVLECLKHNAEFGETRESIRATLSNCLYLSDAVWKFHILPQKWELALPDTKRYALNEEAPLSRPRGRSMLDFHHKEREKIYYFCREFDTDTCNCLFEYDYQINKFRKIELGYTVTEDQLVFNGVIDFSNDTLLLSIWDNAMKTHSILVFCFQTHKSTLIKLKVENPDPEENSFIMQRIGLLNDFEKLVFIPNNFGTKKYKNLASVDWGDVKRKTLNPLLEKFRDYENDQLQKQKHKHRKFRIVKDILGLN